MPRGKRAELKTPMAGYDAGCRVRSTSTQCPTRKSRTSSLPPISRPENAWASRPPSRRFSKSLAKTCVSGSHKPVALRSRIHGPHNGWLVITTWKLGLDLESHLHRRSDEAGKMRDHL